MAELNNRILSDEGFEEDRQKRLAKEGAERDIRQAVLKAGAKHNLSMITFEPTETMIDIVIRCMDAERIWDDSYKSYNEGRRDKAREILKYAIGLDGKDYCDVSTKYNCNRLS